MVESKTKRNAQRSKSGGNFQIRSKPIVHIARHGRSSDVPQGMALPRVYDCPVLFVIAQDEHTIFASWNIDWRSVFGKAMPADRQVYLRLFGCNGLEEKTVAVEPMAAMHYVTISGRHDTYRVEIGYYRPANTWHSVAISEEVKAPSQGSAEIASVDLVTIPFHLRFQQLLDVLGTTNDTRLAIAASRFQDRVLNHQTRNQLSAAERQVLRKLDLSRPQIAATHSDFENTDTKRLARRARSLLAVSSSSPASGFQAWWTLAGS
jgi:hypothetical protein